MSTPWKLFSERAKTSTLTSKLRRFDVTRDSSTRAVPGAERNQERASS